MRQVLSAEHAFYQHLISTGVDEHRIIRFAFDAADELLLIGESLIELEKSNRKVDPEKFMAYIRSKIDDSFKKIIVTKDIVPPHYDEHGILTISIYDFLLDPASIER